MEYSLSPPGSLKEKSLIAAAIALWTKSPVKDEVLRVFEYRSERDFDKKWKKIEKIVQETVKAFELPQTLKTELSGISTQVGLEILGWAKYYGQYYCESAFFNNACWTPQGAIDAEKTARKLVNDESLSILKRYRIACIHCFENRVHDLWNSDKEFFDEQYLREIKKSANKRASRSTNRLIVFWSYYINERIGEIVRDGAINEYGLNVAVEEGNSVAVKYFWEKLTPIEKEKNLEKCIVAAAKESCHYVSGSRYFPNSCYTDIVCFLLNQVGEERQKNILNNPNTAENVLNGLLNFPYQKFFIPTTENVWHDSLVDGLLYYIEKKIHIPFQNYVEVFQYVWNKIHDKDSVNMNWISKILLKLLILKDYDNAKLIFNDLFIVNEGEAFIVSYKREDICCSLISQDKWDKLEFFIKSCLTDRNAAIKFKEKERISYYLLENGLQDQAEKFTKLLDNFIASFEVKLPTQAKEESNKRKVEDDNVRAKRMKAGSEIDQISVVGIEVRQIC